MSTSKTVNKGESVTIKAESKNRNEYSFSHWYVTKGNILQDIDLSDNPLTFTPYGDIELRANFEYISGGSHVSNPDTNVWEDRVHYVTIRGLIQGENDIREDFSHLVLAKELNHFEVDHGTVLDQVDSYFKKTVDYDGNKYTYIGLYDVIKNGKYYSIEGRTPTTEELTIDEGAIITGWYKRLPKNARPGYEDTPI